MRRSVSEDRPTNDKQVTARSSFLISIVAIASLIFGVVSPAGAVLNGAKIDVGDQPEWLVRLETSVGGLCTGALVDAEYVVTAAHCVDVTSNGVRRALSPGSVTGYHNFDTTQKGDVEATLKFQDVAIHEDYFGDSLVHDLAILHLSTPVAENVQVLAIDGAVVNAQAKVYGFGDYYVTKGDPKGSGDARSLLGTVWNGSNLLGVKPSDGDQSVCPGDSGGPVVQNNRLVAVVVGGECLRSYVATAVDLRLSSNLQFIKLFIAQRECQHATDGSNIRLVGWGELSGTSADIVVGTNGADTLFGHGGNDTLCGRKGEDVLFGGDGKDKLYGDNGADRLYGGAGDDIIQGNNGNDYIAGGNGNDILHGGKNNDHIKGEGGKDTLNGNNAHDLLEGGEGDDVLYGNRGTDVLEGGSGNDFLNGGEKVDDLNGGTGLDTCKRSDGGATISCDTLLD